MDDLLLAIERAEQQGNSRDCELIIHHINARVTELRALQSRAHAILEKKIAEERQVELRTRPANFPKEQVIGAQ